MVITHYFFVIFPAYYVGTVIETGHFTIFIYHVYSLLVYIICGFLIIEACGQRSLAGYSPWGHRVLDMTEHTTHAAEGNAGWEG